MSQIETLQDIYSEIADIFDKLCELSGDIQTSITEDTTLDGYTSTGVTLSNPDDKPEISSAEENINSLITLALTTAYNNRLSTDAESQDSNGDLVPFPDSAPIALLPKLINILVGFNAPLKVITQILSDYIGSILLEQIKRKLNEKSPKCFGTTYDDKSFIVKVPPDAEQMCIQIYNYPSWISKVYEPVELDKSILGQGQSQNLDRFTRYGLGTATFGVEIEKESGNKSVFWFKENVIIRDFSFVEVPKFLWSTDNFFCFIYLEYQCVCDVAFIKGVKLVSPQTN